MDQYRYKNLILLTLVLAGSFLWGSSALAVTVSVSSNMNFCYTLNGPPGSFSFCDSGQSFSGLPDGTYCGSIDSGPVGYTPDNSGGCSTGSGSDTLGWSVTWSTVAPPTPTPPPPGSTLTLVKSGNGMGTVSDGASVCDPSCPGASVVYPVGTTVTLTATGASTIISPSTGFYSTFNGWKGACGGRGTCTVTMNSNINVEAEFFSGPTITLTKQGTGTGTVDDGVWGNVCNASCPVGVGYYAYGGTVTLTANPSAGSVFAGWGGLCAPFGTNPICSGTITRNVDVTASFNIAGGSTPTPTPGGPTPTPGGPTPTPGGPTPTPGGPTPTFIPTPLPPGGGGGSATGTSIGWNLINPLYGNPQTIFGLIALIANWILNIAGSLIVLLIIYSGVRFVISKGNPGEIQKAKGILKWALIGFAVVLVGKGFIFIVDSILSGNIPTF